MGARMEWGAKMLGTSGVLMIAGDIRDGAKVA